MTAHIAGRAAGIRLRLHRQRTGVTANALASRLGISRAALYRYEHGDVIKLETVQQIADLIGVTFGDTIRPLTALEQVEALLAPGKSEPELLALTRPGTAPVCGDAR